VCFLCVGHVSELCKTVVPIKMSFQRLIRVGPKHEINGVHHTIRYDSRSYFNVTQVGLIYRAEPTTKMCKKIEKLKSKSRYVRSNSKSLGNRVVSSEEEKERLQ